MVLYLAAAVIGVAAIVFLVIHLAKGGSSTASGASTPGATTTAGGGAGQGYVLRQAATVGKYPLEQAGGQPDIRPDHERDVENHQQDGGHPVG